jgi:hypothetical protein
MPSAIVDMPDGKETLLAQVASNVVDLAAYRAQHTAKCSADPGTAPVPIMPMVWGFVWVPVWPVFADHSGTHD